MNSNNGTYDILVLGGGLVGLTVVNLLAKQGLTVGLLEKNPPSFSSEGLKEDIRFSAISPGSAEIFQSIGVWESIVERGVSAYEKMVVWDAIGFGEISFDACEVNAPNLGTIVQNKIIIQALWEKAKERSEVHFILGKTPCHVIIEKDTVCIQMNDNETVKAKCLVGADGAESWLRTYLKFETTMVDYEQQALVATVETALPHCQTAWQRFLPEGPLAFLPLKEPNQSSIVWSTTPKEAERLMALTAPDFCEILTHQFDHRLGQVLKTSARCTFPLKKIQVKNLVKHRVGLIGDAAHVVHPLAGQGVNLGLIDAKLLAETISKASDAGFDVGDFLVLRRYERSVRGKISSMMMGIDFLKHFFSFKSTAAIGLRSIVLNYFDKSKGLKKQAMWQAMGRGD